MFSSQIAQQSCQIPAWMTSIICNCREAFRQLARCPSPHFQQRLRRESSRPLGPLEATLNRSWQYTIEDRRSARGWSQAMRTTTETKRCLSMRLENHQPANSSNFVTRRSESRRASFATLTCTTACTPTGVLCSWAWHLRSAFLVCHSRNGCNARVIRRSDNCKIRASLHA